MNLRNLSVGLILAVLLVGLFSCKGEHACEGYWEGDGISRTHECYRLSVRDDGTFSLTIIPEAPDYKNPWYSGPQTNYIGKWETLSDGEIELTSRVRRTESSGNTKESVESETFYLRQDGAFCKHNPNFQYPDVDLMKTR